MFLAMPVHAQEANPDYVVILGDSQCRIALSWGAGSSGNLAKLINQVGYNTNVFCHGGYALDRLLTTLPSELEGAKSSRGKNPIAIVVFAPGNGNATAEQTNAIVDLFKRYTSNIIWFGPYYSPDATVMSTHRANHATVSTALQAKGVFYKNNIDVDPNLAYKDKAHFTTESYATLASRWIEIIRPRLNGTVSPDATSAPTPETANPAAEGETPPSAPTATAGGSTGQLQAGTPLEVQCAGDLDPVFPVKLGISVGGVSEVNGLTEYINVVYRYMTAIVLVATIVMITFGGFKYLLSATPAGISDGKSIIQDGLIGMVLVLSAYVILNTINPALTVLQFTQPPVSIRCEDYLASIGRNIYGGNNGNVLSGRGESPELATLRAEFDPMNLRNASYPECALSGAGVELDTLCGKRSDGVNAECVDGGKDFAQAINNLSSSADSVVENFPENSCSKGGLHERCEDSTDCINNMECVAGWNVCAPEEAAYGSACSNQTGENTCAGGLSVLACKRLDANSPYPDEFNHGELEVCSKQIAPLTHDEISQANAGNLPVERQCTTHRDCVGTGIAGSQSRTVRCTGVRSGTTKRFCVEQVESLDGVACGYLDIPTGGKRFPCDGTNGYKCAYCPAGTPRVWKTVGVEQGKEFIGQCKPNAQVDTNTVCGN